MHLLAPLRHCASILIGVEHASLRACLIYTWESVPIDQRVVFVVVCIDMLQCVIVGLGGLAGSRRINLKQENKPKKPQLLSSSIAVCCQ
jgi:hypothetical protein